MRVRAFAVPGVGLAAVLTGLLTFGNLNDNLVYYLTPGEASAQRAGGGDGAKGADRADGRRFRLGGLVEEGSVQRTADGVRFTVVDTDGTSPVQVVHTGAPNQLFQAGIGVVVEGTWRGTVFASDTMIVKHNEEYRPPASTAGGGAP